MCIPSHSGSYITRRQMGTTDLRRPALRRHSKPRHGHLSSSCLQPRPRLKLLNRQTTSPRQSGQTGQMKLDQQCCPAVLNNL